MEAFDCARNFVDYLEQAAGLAGSEIGGLDWSRMNQLAGANCDPAMGHG